MQLVIESTCIADWFPLIVPPPQRGGGGPAVSAAQAQPPGGGGEHGALGVEVNLQQHMMCVCVCMTLWGKNNSELVTLGETTLLQQKLMT